MCGINGFIDFNNSSSKDILKQSTDCMTHRGLTVAGMSFFSMIGSR
jgi:asparagine synthetase B (glutamine-hydrolysing)